MAELPNIFLIQFLPEKWTSLHKLLAFVGPPLPDSADVRIGLRDCERHLNKTELFWRIAQRLRPNLMLDREEMDRLGGTSNLNSQEFAAICESIVCTFYSALDGLRTFLFGVYRDVQGIQNASNGKLFERAKEKKYGPGFPDKINTLLAEAYDTWFSNFRRFRSELTHGSTGGCHLDTKTDLIRYMNEGIKIGDRIFILEDVEQFLRETDDQIRTLILAIADYHFAMLEPIPRLQVCGVFKGRLYLRTVAPSAILTFADGQCLSYDWFELLEGHFCPMASKCGAYQRKWPGGSTRFLNPQAEQ